MSIWISLTTHAQRINLIEPVIESWLDPRLWGDKYKDFSGVLLSLGKNDGRTGENILLPKWCTNGKYKNLYVSQWKDDWGPIMKFIGVLKFDKMKKDDIIISVDDDIRIDKDTFKKLIDGNILYPESITCVVGGHIIESGERFITLQADQISKRREVDFFCTGGGGTVWKRSWISDDFTNIIKKHIIDKRDKNFYFSDDLVASWWFRKVKNLKIIENCFRQEQSCRKNREDYHLDKYAIHKGANGATSRFGFDWPMYQKTYKILKKL